MTALLQQLANSSIAVVRALQLGDLLCAVPALRSLRAAAPQARITLIGLPWARQFVERYSDYLDDFLEFPGFPGIPEISVDENRLQTFLASARERQFDLALQLHGSGPFINSFVQQLGAAHTAGFYLEGSACPDRTTYLPWPEHGHEIQRMTSLMRFLGAPDCGDELELPLSPQDRDAADELLRQNHLVPQQFVCVHPGGRMATRRWNLGKFAEVCDWLHQREFDVVLTGASFESHLAHALCQRTDCQAIDLSGKTTIGSLAALLSKARLLICNDTAISHIAAAVRVPSVIIVLGSDPDRWAPINHRIHRTVLSHVGCRPCGYHECPIGFACEEQVTAGAVIESIEHLLTRDNDLSHAPIGAAEDTAAHGILLSNSAL